MSPWPDNANVADAPAPLRLACYGYAQQDAGSVSSAGHVILRQMLDRGHQVDFFGKRSFAHPVGFDHCPNFRFISVEGRAERSFGRAANNGPKLWRAAMASLTSGQTNRNVSAAIAAEHPRRHYAVQLFLGNWAFAKLPGLPSVSWVQGPPGTDSRSVSRHARDLIRLEGLPRYAALRAYSAYRETLGGPPVRHTDRVICGSRWAAGILKQHVPATVPIDPLPYPVDLTTFCPDPATPRAPTPEILWLGRAVPRKRLDLFLAACERLIETGRTLTVRGVGGFGFAQGYRRLLQTFRYPDRLHWTDGVPRDDVPALLRRATVLVQPSEDENFGSSVAEALACGTPVVLGPTNGTGDYIGQGGRRFDRYDPAAVAAAIAQVLDDVAADPAATSSHARAAAEAAFDVRRIVDQLEAVLRRVAFRSPEPADARLEPAIT